MADAVAPAWQRLRGYWTHDDPQASLANFVALIVVWNQPFYPLYVWWAAGPQIWPSYYTFLSTPFFAAVPAVMRRNTRAGRALLVVAGVANTALTAKAFGVASAVEAFLIPCALLAAILFRPAERLLSFALVAVCLAVFMGMHGRYGAPFHVYGEAEYAALLTLNATSAGLLTAVIGFLAAKLIGRN
ncbi:MAG: hypothetical protein AB7I79_01240 [Rhizobiaceae bacterium]